MFSWYLMAPSVDELTVWFRLIFHLPPRTKEFLLAYPFYVDYIKCSEKDSFEFYVYYSNGTSFFYFL